MVDSSVFILGMGSANERRRYIVTSSHIVWSHTKNDPCIGTTPRGMDEIELFENHNTTQ